MLFDDVKLQCIEKTLPKSILWQNYLIEDLSKFAKCILCPNTSVGNCICKLCLAIDRQECDDFKIIDSKNVGIESIRNLVSNYWRKPKFGKYQILLFNNANSIDIYSWQMLLKILEEPPVHSWIWLQCDTLNNIPKTILSRVNIYLGSNLKLTNNNVYDQLKLFFNKEIDCKNLASFLKKNDKKNIEKLILEALTIILLEPNKSINIYLLYKIFIDIETGLKTPRNINMDYFVSQIKKAMY